MFSMVEVGERAGSGLSKIFAGWAEAGYDEPFYAEEFGPDRTTLTLPLTAGQNDSADTERSRTAESGQDRSYQGTLERQQAILAILGASPEPMKSSEISAKSGLRKTRTNELLHELVDAGLVRADGTTSNRTYRIDREE